MERRVKRTSIGGQALIEGLMMIGPQNAAIAIRKPDGEIIVDKRPLPPKNIISRIPVIRGIKAFFRQMLLGVKALMYSAEFVEIEDMDARPSKADKFIDRVFGDKFKDAAIYFAVLVSIAFSIGLFILLPNLIASVLKFNRETAGGVILYNLFEGLLRMTIFLTYLALASRMKDIKRVWQYHGAEHKVIHAYEHGEELTVENVRKYSAKHPRCGTSFLFIVIIMSMVIFSFLGWHNFIINIAARIILVPFVAGLSYELLKLAGKCRWKAADIINAPGLAFQRLTTKEPDDEMLEVAITALNNVLVKDDEKADEW